MTAYGRSGSIFFPYISNHGICSIPRNILGVIEVVRIVFSVSDDLSR